MMERLKDYYYDNETYFVFAGGCLVGFLFSAGVLLWSFR